MPVASVSWNVAPFDTEKFLAAASAIAKPPLLKLPVWMLKFPVTFAAAIAALVSVAPAALFVVMLLYTMALTPIGMFCAAPPLKSNVLVAPAVSVPRDDADGFNAPAR